MVRLTDVVLRDGLQDVDILVSTPDKISIAHALVAAGISELEVASFVSPRTVPQMGDAVTVLEDLHTLQSTWICAIALNGRGIQRASTAPLDELRLVVSAGTGHSMANAGKSPQQVIDQYATTLRAVPVTFEVTGAVSTAFNCPYDGPVSPSTTCDIVRRIVELGATRVSLADTLGTATTTSVLQTLTAVREQFPTLPLGLHLHDGHRQALATVEAALPLGVDQFDSSLAGLGGCPFAPGAKGNLDTAQLVSFLTALGIDLGIDLPELNHAKAVLDRALARGTALNPATTDTPARRHHEIGNTSVNPATR